MVDHICNRRNFSALFVNILMKTLDRWKERIRTGSIYNNVRVHASDHFNRSFRVLEDEQVFQLACAMDQIVREVSKSLLIRDLGDQGGKSAEFRFLLDQESSASNLGSCTCSFQSGSTTTDHNNVARLVDFLLFVIFAAIYRRVNSTTDRTVDSDTVSCTSDVTRNTFTDITFITEFYFIYPFWISDQSTSHTDQVSIASCKNIFGNLWVTDVTHCHTWFAVTFFYSFCHIRTPSIRKVIGINLVLNGSVQTGRYVEYVNLFLEVLQVIKTVIQSISAFHKFIRTDTNKDREEWSNLSSNFFNNKFCKSCTVFQRSAEFVCSLICKR